jgi:putative endonuclease
VGPQSVGFRKKEYAANAAFFIIKMSCCYIIYSPAFEKFYIGASSESALDRLKKHNDKSYGSAYTAFTNEWELFLEIKCSSFAQAINIERHIKRMKSRQYLFNLLNYPEIIQRLLEKY